MPTSLSTLTKQLTAMQRQIDCLAQRRESPLVPLIRYHLPTQRSARR